MSKPFQFTKRTIPFALACLFLSVAACAFGMLVLDYDLTAAVVGFVVAFNSFWGAFDTLRGRSFARILLDRAILVFIMLMAYWILRTGSHGGTSDAGTMSAP